MRPAGPGTRPDAAHAARPGRRSSRPTRVMRAPAATPATPPTARLEPERERPAHHPHLRLWHRPQPAGAGGRSACACRPCCRDAGRGRGAGDAEDLLPPAPPADRRRRGARLPGLRAARQHHQPDGALPGRSSSTCAWRHPVRRPSNAPTSAMAETQRGHRPRESGQTSVDLRPSARPSAAISTRWCGRPIWCPTAMAANRIATCASSTRRATTDRL